MGWHNYNVGVWVACGSRFSSQPVSLAWPWRKVPKGDLWNTLASSLAWLLGNRIVKVSQDVVRPGSSKEPITNFNLRNGAWCAENLCYTVLETNAGLSGWARSRSTGVRPKSDLWLGECRLWTSSVNNGIKGLPSEHGTKGLPSEQWYQGALKFSVRFLISVGTHFPKHAYSPPHLNSI